MKPVRRIRFTLLALMPLLLIACAHGEEERFPSERREMIAEEKATWQQLSEDEPFFQSFRTHLYRGIDAQALRLAATSVLEPVGFRSARPGPGDAPEGSTTCRPEQNLGPDIVGGLLGLVVEGLSGGFWRVISPTSYRLCAHTEVRHVTNTNHCLAVLFFLRIEYAPFGSNEEKDTVFHDPRYYRDFFVALDEEIGSNPATSTQQAGCKGATTPGGPSSSS